MSPLAKSLFAALSVAVVMAATLSLRGKSAPASRPQLTQAQRAEVPAPPQPAPPRMTEPVNDPADLPPPPDDEPDLEDGSGS